MTVQEIISTLKNRPVSNYSTSSLNDSNYTWDPDRTSDGNFYKVKATWAGRGTWDNYYCYSRLMNWEVRNKWARQNLNGNQDIVVSIPRISGLSIKSWMGFFWDNIKNMSANQFIFPGTHDSLTGYPIKNVLNTFLSRAQSKTITQQLNGGCRFFDLRFLNVPNTFPTTGNVNINNFWGVHSGNCVNVTVGNILDEIKNFLNTNPNEVLAINLSLFLKSSYNSGSSTKNPFFNNLFNIGNDEFASAATYNDFIDLCDTKGLKNKIIKSGDPKSSLQTLTQGGGRIMFFTSLNLGPVTNKDYFWINKQESCTNAFTQEITPQEWYSVILQTDNNNGKYLNNLLSSNNVFNYLSMTQTGKSPDDYSKKINGVLADWILYANPDTNEASRPPVYPSDNIPSSANAAMVQNQLPTNYFQLPYKPYKDANGNPKFLSNYNFIAMDFYERSPFIINCITKNLEASIS